MQSIAISRILQGRVGNEVARAAAKRWEINVLTFVSHSCLDTSRIDGQVGRPTFPVTASSQHKSWNYLPVCCYPRCYNAKAVRLLFPLGNRVLLNELERRLCDLSALGRCPFWRLQKD